MRRTIVRLTANDTESVTAMRIEKFNPVTMRSLSPGERAGVRASVNTHPTKKTYARFNFARFHKYPTSLVFFRK